MRIDRFFLDRLGHSALQSFRRDGKKSEVKQELQKIVSQAHETIFTAKTVFPFTLFPDIVTIDRTKLSITRRDFFSVGGVVSVKIEDILNVTANIGPFFGSIQIHTRFFDPHRPYTVNFLKRNDALKIDRIMHGYSIALDKKIDCSVLSAKELSETLNKLGEGAPSGKI